MAAKKEKKQKPLEQVLMESCNKLRSNMSGINYMYFVMSLVFLKFASLKFEKRREELLNSEDAFVVDIPSFYAEKNVFYIPEQARWSLIKNNAKNNKITLKVIEGGLTKEKDFTIGMLIDRALEELEKNNQQLKGAFPIGTYAKSNLPASNFASLIDSDEKLIDLAKKVKAVVDDKAKYTDWSSKSDIKASLQSDVIHLLNRNGYPPMTFEDVYVKVLAQVENFKRYEE